MKLISHITWITHFLDGLESNFPPPWLQSNLITICYWYIFSYQPRNHFSVKRVNRLAWILRYIIFCTQYCNRPPAPFDKQWSSSSVRTMEKNENDIREQLIILDNGGRRSGGDRRNYSYTLHIPERRSGDDRRSGTDRRKFPRAKEVAQDNSSNPWIRILNNVLNYYAFI